MIGTSTCRLVDESWSAMNLKKFSLLSTGTSPACRHVLFGYKRGSGTARSRMLARTRWQIFPPRVPAERLVFTYNTFIRRVIAKLLRLRTTPSMNPLPVLLANAKLSLTLLAFLNTLGRSPQSDLVMCMVAHVQYELHPEGLLQ